MRLDAGSLSSARRHLHDVDRYFDRGTARTIEAAGDEHIAAASLDVLSQGLSDEISQRGSPPFVLLDQDSVRGCIEYYLGAIHQ